ncbi:MAG: class I SAM-dependent methyltransferase [Hyphomicrobiaceae bacterium]
MTETSQPSPTASAYYDADYFEWQRKSGRLGGWANVDKYRNTVRPTDRVLDFGCGGGFLVANLTCAERFGIEPNPAGREMAKSNGVTVFASPADALAALGEGTLDLIISDNALEHALEPYRELQALMPLLKVGGRIHFVVPCEGIGWKFKADDINQHVYSWSPQSIGNLVKAAGYEVEFSRAYIHKWPPRIAYQMQRLGRPAFNFASRVWGHLDRRWFQVEVRASKPNRSHV